jgi:hypothetical protein
MDADTFPEETVFIPDGAQGATAPTPVVTVNPVEGGTNVAFDMDADTFPEETVFIPDGAQGATAPTPIVSVNDVEGGKNVAFDMDADTFPEETVFIPIGGNVQTPPSQQDFTDTEWCNAALYIAETFYDQAVSLFTNAPIAPTVGDITEFLVGLSTTTFLPMSVKMLIATDTLLLLGELNDRTDQLTDLIDIKPRWHEAIYCENLDTVQKFADWILGDLEIGSVTSEYLASWILTLGDDNFASWASLGAGGTTADCSEFCPATLTETYDFEVSNQDPPWAIRAGSGFGALYVASVGYTQNNLQYGCQIKYDFGELRNVVRVRFISSNPGAETTVQCQIYDSDPVVSKKTFANIGDNEWIPASPEPMNGILLVTDNSGDNSRIEWCEIEYEV